MSNEQKQTSNARQESLENQPLQAERDTQIAEIVHADGSVEQVALRSERMWSGALPRPEDFAKYAEIVPDAPERILRMAEREQEHRMNMEEQIVPAGLQSGKRGQWLGALISLAALGLAVFSFSIGAPWQLGVALVGVPVLGVAKSLVSAFRRSED